MSSLYCCNTSDLKLSYQLFSSLAIRSHPDLVLWANQKQILRNGETTKSSIQNKVSEDTYLNSTNTKRWNAIRISFWSSDWQTAVKFNLSECCVGKHRAFSHFRKNFISYWNAHNNPKQWPKLSLVLPLAIWTLTTFLKSWVRSVQVPIWFHSVLNHDYNCLMFIRTFRLKSEPQPQQQLNYF